MSFNKILNIICKNIYEILLFEKKIFKIILLINIFLLLFNKYDNLLKKLSLHQRKILLKEIKEYIIICKKGNFTNSFNNKPKEIKITALIPLFNCSDSINATIRSIQNQNMKEIEILLVDDLSLDNTISIIENLQKVEPRITLIKNKINKGTLFSRSIGAIYSKGKYIMSIDNDDLFYKNIFSICYLQAEFYKLDILEFSGYELEKNFFKKKSPVNIPFYLTHKTNNTIIYQPELSDFIFVKQNNNYCLIDAFIWGKAIRSSIYKKALSLIGKDMYSSFICWSEDRIVNFALFMMANSFQFIDIIGVIHFLHPTSIGHSWKILHKERIAHDEIMYVNNLYNLTKFSDKLDIAAFEMIRLYSDISPGLVGSNIFLAKSLYYNLINSKHVSNARKNEIISLYKILIY